MIAARDNCVVDSMEQAWEHKITSILDDSKKTRKVRFDTNMAIAHYSCMLFETHRIPCRHIVLVLRGARLHELPSNYVLKRWTRKCKRDVVFL